MQTWFNYNFELKNKEFKFIVILFLSNHFMDETKVHAEMKLQIERYIKFDNVREHSSFLVKFLKIKIFTLF